jgi:hypothetical protein
VTKYMRARIHNTFEHVVIMLRQSADHLLTGGPSLADAAVSRCTATWQKLDGLVVRAGCLLKTTRKSLADGVTWSWYVLCPHSAASRHVGDSGCWWHVAMPSGGQVEICPVVA